MITKLVGYDEKLLKEVDDRLESCDDKMNIACEKLRNDNRYMSIAELIGLAIGIGLDVPMDLLCKDVDEVNGEEDDVDYFMRGLLGSIITNLEKEQMLIEYTHE